jgi:hypothetical protein
MNEYYLFVEKLKALHLQGYSKQYIIDIWNAGKNDVLYLLEKELVLATLTESKADINSVKIFINNIKTMDKRIQVGLLENISELNNDIQ